ncbi:MAG: HNH endonuclease [Microbacteriaceae bacterium]|nr:HNH endonuclease [Microbacteriaceae bacterium]MCL2795618.1 HNH endonuclease [Microbacteriaceae bacterium]
MSIEDVFDSPMARGAAGEFRVAELAELARGHLLDRVRALDTEIAALQAQRVQLLGRIGDEAMQQAELDVELHPDEPLDRRRDLQWRSAALGVAAATNIGAEAARRQLAEAWVLTQKCQSSLRALLCGDISLGHARVIAREVAEMDVVAAGAAQSALLPYAQRLSVGLFARKAREVLDRNDPEKLVDRHRRAYADRNLSLDGARDGMATLTAYLDAADAAVIRSGLSNAAQSARRSGDARTRRQLEVDLFVDLLMEGEVTVGRIDGAAVGDATTATAAPPDRLESGALVGAGLGVSTSNRLDRARVVDLAPVTVSLLVPAATAAGGDDAPGKIEGVGMIDPGKARELIARAPSLRRILTDPIQSAVVDFDRKTYRVPAELKRMILLRDGRCRAPNCGRPIAEIDHSRDFARGGTTSRANLAGLCRSHHHVKHETAWRLTQLADGVLDWVGPNDRHYRTYPDTILPAPPPPDPVEEWEEAPFDLPSKRRPDRAA